MNEKKVHTMMNQRQYIQHSYHDRSQTIPESYEDILTTHNFPGSHEEEKVQDSLDSNKSKGEATHFPSKLHRLLDDSEQNDIAHIISWQIHGRAFKIHKRKDFLEKVVPIHFQQTKLASFRRQLNLYGFLRISQGPDKGSYYNELFLRGKRFLADRIIRRGVKGNKVKGVPNPEREPDFYNMPFMDNLAQGHDKLTLSSTSKSFSTEYPALPIPTHSPEFHPAVTGKGFHSASRCFSDSSAFKDNRGKFSIDSSSKIDQSPCNEWELDAFSLEDTIFHDYMIDYSSQEEDIWSLSCPMTLPFILPSGGRAQYSPPYNW
jgi:hypothetical protein